MFLLGMAFCYFLMLQVALGATVQFSNWLGFGADEWRAEDYISFVCKFMLGMGLGFEMPVVVLTLVKLGVVDYVVETGAGVTGWSAGDRVALEPGTDFRAAALAEAFVPAKRAVTSL